LGVLVSDLGVVSGVVLLGEVLSEGLVESEGFVESEGLLEPLGGEARLPEEPTSPLLVSFVSVLVAVPDAEPSDDFLCFLVVVVVDESPWMPVVESDLLLLSLGSAELSVLLGVEVVVVVCWSIELLGLLEPSARAPNAVKPSASAVIAKYFMPSPCGMFVSTEAGHSTSRCNRR
jgi:hypothetical protein